MKKTNLLGMLAICAAALTGCQDKQQPAETPKLEVTSESPLVFSDIEETKTIEIIANNAWEAADDAEWLTVEPAKGEASSEKQIIEVTAERNEGAERPAVITIKSAGLTKTVEVRQNKVVYADFSVDETLIQALATDEEKTFSVTAGEGVEWTVTSENATVVAPEGGRSTGNGTVTLSFPANEDVENGRTYTAVVSTTALVETDSYTVTINQAAAIFVPMLEISTSEIPALVKAEGENLTFTITSNIGWTIETDEGATVNPLSGNNTYENVRLDIAANTEAVEKTYTVTVSPAEGVESVEPKSFTVKQAAAEVKPYFNVTNAVNSVVEVAADATSVTLKVETNYDSWTLNVTDLRVSGDYTWMAPYSGNSEVNITFPANTSSTEVTYTIPFCEPGPLGMTGPEITTITIRQAAAATQPAGPRFEKVTTAPADWTGDYLLVDETSGKAFKASAYESSYVSSNTFDVTITDGTIAYGTDTKNERVQISVFEGNYSLRLKYAATYLSCDDGGETQTGPARGVTIAFEEATALATFTDAKYPYIFVYDAVSGKFCHRSALTDTRRALSLYKYIAQ